MLLLQLLLRLHPVRGLAREPLDWLALVARIRQLARGPIVGLFEGLLLLLLAHHRRAPELGAGQALHLHRRRLATCRGRRRATCRLVRNHLGPAVCGQLAARLEALAHWSLAACDRPLAHLLDMSSQRLAVLSNLLLANCVRVCA